MKNFKRISLVSIVVLAGSLLLAGCNQSGGKAGTVDMMKLMKSPELKTISQSMMTQDKGAQAQFKAAYDAMEAAKSSAQKYQSSATKAKAKAAKAKFRGMMASFQKQQQSQEAMLKGYVIAAIATVAKSKGLSAVYIKEVVLFSSNADITQAVIAQLQSDKK